MNVAYSGIGRKLGRQQSRADAGAERAFTRSDLMVVIGVVGILLGWFGLWQFGEYGRIARCAANLRVLGQAMQSFANDHQDALPPAVAGQTAWDAQIAPYLPEKLAKRGLDSLFRCPSDRLAHSRARSYAMSAHDMHLDNWPLGPNNDTGVGLVWSQESMQRVLNEQQCKMAATNMDFLAMMKRSSIPVPAKTLLLTEMISSQNNLKDTTLAAISGPDEQLQGFVNKNAYIHYGRYNYLMMDGHVELLFPLQTEAPGGGGIWNISKSN